MKLKDMNAETVMQVMDQQQLAWERSWADQVDLKDAMEQANLRDGTDLLQQRCRDKVMLVLRAAYLLETREDPMTIWKFYGTKDHPAMDWSVEKVDGVWYVIESYMSAPDLWIRNTDVESEQAGWDWIAAWFASLYEEN